MVHIRKFLFICAVLLLSGCSTLGNKEETFREGYQTGVRQNVQDFTKNFIKVNICKGSPGRLFSRGRSIDKPLHNKRERCGRFRLGKRFRQRKPLHLP